MRHSVLTTLKMKNKSKCLSCISSPSHQVCSAVRPAVADAAGEGDGGGGEEFLDAVAVEVGEAARQAQVHQGDVVVQRPQAVPCKKV